MCVCGRGCGGGGDGVLGRSVWSNFCKRATSPTRSTKMLHFRGNPISYTIPLRWPPRWPSSCGDRIHFEKHRVQILVELVAVLSHVWRNGVSSTVPSTAGYTVTGMRQQVWRLRHSVCCRDKKQSANKQCRYWDCWHVVSTHGNPLSYTMQLRQRWIQYAIRQTQAKWADLHYHHVPQPRDSMLESSTPTRW